MKLSVVIPAYNAAATLAACLEGCQRQTLPATEIIIVDDGSNDDTAAVVQRMEGVTYIHQPNAGPAAARNRGAEAATGDLIVFTDADCIPASDWLEKLVAALRDDAVAVGGSYDIANPDALLARIIHAEIRLRHARLSDEVDFLGSFNVAYRRDAYLAVGGFDTTFRAASGEDNDLAYRLQDAAGILLFTPQACVAHLHPTRLWPYLRTQHGHGFWRAKLYAKHPGRARTGDHYAPLSDMLGIPLSLGNFLLVPALLLLALIQPLALGGIGLLVVLHVLLHLPMALRLRDHAGTVERLCYPPLAASRDDARALGFLRGLFRFVLLGKESA